MTARADVGTANGSGPPCMGLTGKCGTQTRTTSHAQHRQDQIGKAVEILQEEATNDLKEFNLLPGRMGKIGEKAFQFLYPLHDVPVKKVKMLKKIRFGLGKLLKLHVVEDSSEKATGDEKSTNGRWGHAQRFQLRICLKSRPLKTY